MFKKIVFMGTPNFSVPILKSLYQNGYPTCAVYTQPPKKSMRGQKTNKSPIQKLAENLSLNVRNPNFLNQNEEELKYFKSLSADIVIVVAYGQLIPKEFLGLSKNGFINIHASLLPKWRGAAPIQRAIMNLDEVTGISVMRINEKLDAGPTMLKKEIKLDNEMNAEDVSNQLSKIGSEIISNCLDLIEIGKAEFVEQDHNKATHAQKIDKEEAKIKWNEDAIKIIAKINGLYPNPGAWFLFQGERYKILKATLSDLEGQPGSVLDDNLTVACGTKSIKIQEIQRQGKSKQKATEFLLGSKIKKSLALI
jgi:methionyl-tRNA formyltransferase